MTKKTKFNLEQLINENLESFVMEELKKLEADNNFLNQLLEDFYYLEKVKEKQGPIESIAIRIFNYKGLAGSN